jgi:hypothetical protein
MRLFLRWLRLGAQVIYRFESTALDTERRELCRGGMLCPIEPQIFDLLEYLIRNRHRVVIFQPDRANLQLRRAEAILGSSLSELKNDDNHWSKFTA